ncbi:MAG: hypothetical protein C4567_13135 [Deltaproteobacteria bacterium]|nr:MAG: hypothetical protein C4567_13135 [Deltaproteobacteria bacterium]
MANQISLFLDWVFGMTDYIERHAANYALIESVLNQILGQLTGQSGGISVPYGLQEIFDRRGLIGRDSYDFEEGILTGPDYNFQVAPGAYWSNGTFYRKTSPFTLSMAGKESGVYFLNLDAAGNPLVSSAADATITRQFSWDAGTHTISGKALYTGVNILFDGGDYADMLDSAARGKSFTRVADRLEELEQGGDIFGGNYAQDLPHSGLSFKFKAGKVRNDSFITDTPAGQVALTNGATNYVEVDPVTGVVAANQTGFTSGQIPLYQVLTAANAITIVNDKRTPAVAGTGGGGGGGGHTQGTDTGTTAPTFIIDSDAAGNPTGRAGLEVENGDDPNAALKFNRDTGKWEYTGDGGASWKELGEADLDLGAQELTKYVPQEDPPLVLETLGRGSSFDYEDLDLSPHISAPLGAAAAVLRVQFWDAAPGEGIKVLFKKRGSPGNPVTAYTVWSGVNDPGTIVVPLDTGLACQYYVFASGADTANIRIFLQGFLEKVTGVGTQEKTFSQDNISCPANSQVNLTLENFVNRGLVHYFKIEETSGLPTNVFDVHLYADSSFSTLLYKVENIGPGTPFEDWLPFWAYDAGREKKLRLRLINHDASHAGTFSLTVTAEQFA